MASEQIDLLSLFGQATKTLKKNQTTLNQADTYNHDHGDHMVEIFDVITQAMKAKKNAAISAAPIWMRNRKIHTNTSSACNDSNGAKPSIRPHAIPAAIWLVPVSELSSLNSAKICFNISVIDHFSASMARTGHAIP